MKSNILKTSAVFIVVIFSILYFNNINAGITAFKGAACPITIKFCVTSVGTPQSGIQINIYSTGSCLSSPIAQITTGSDGCAKYTFNSNCNQEHSINLTCAGSPSQCVGFTPDDIGNNGQVNINECP